MREDDKNEPNNIKTEDIIKIDNNKKENESALVFMKLRAHSAY